MNRPFLRGVQAALLFAMWATFTVSVARAQDGAKLYTASKCASCHGPDGTGSTPAGKALKARDFHSPDVKSESDADLAAVIANGKNKMPAYNKQLKPADIQALVAYVRDLGNK
ncbi:MAG TPA: cytochrome c [Candidatus Acidoferrales bacterium]|nr:cytochrome c [Candidatus Acidoferrales bacterium]